MLLALAFLAILGTLFGTGVIKLPVPNKEKITTQVPTTTSITTQVPTTTYSTRIPAIRIPATTQTPIIIPKL